MVHEAKEKKILKWLVRYDSNLLLFHHRRPTSTINVKRAAHPFSTKKYFKGVQYVLVHNGHISNSRELRKQHEKLGITYQTVLQDGTFNDSEALLWDFALFMEGRQEELTAKGGIAFIALKLKKGRLNKMYFGRNTNPLRMTRTKEEISLASELKDGEMVDADMLYTWNYKLKRLTKRKVIIPTAWSSYTYTGKEYKHQKRTWDDEDDGYDPACNRCRTWGFACDAHWSQRVSVENKKNDTTNILAKQFGEKFGMKNAKLIETGGTKEEHKVESLSDVLERQREAEEKIIASDPISDEEVTQEYMAYLAGCKGHFESAYWMIEADYEVAQDESNTKDSIRRRRLLEKVMERIDTDPEYVGQDSISSIWEMLWKQVQRQAQ